MSIIPIFLNLRACRHRISTLIYDLVRKARGSQYYDGWCLNSKPYLVMNNLLH